MKKAIDGFKQLKQAKEAEPVIQPQPSQLFSKQSSLIMDVSHSTACQEDRAAQECPVVIMVEEDPKPAGCIVRQQPMLLNSRTFQDLYLAQRQYEEEYLYPPEPLTLDFDGSDSRYVNPLQLVTRDVQCDILNVDDQVRFVSLHNQQLLLYREQLDLMQGDLSRSQQQETLLRGQLDQAAEDLAIL